MPELTIVIPAYNEGPGLFACVELLLGQTKADGLDPALVLVDDGSADSTWEQMLLLAEKYPRISCVKLSRNFGKEAAIFAGIERVTSELCLVMDADMQHPPSVIRRMYDKMALTGCDIVEGVKAARGKETASSSFFARGFYGLLRLLGGVDLANSSDFKLLNRGAVEAVNRFRESAVFFRGLIQWSGFHREKVYFSVGGRAGGKSSFSSGMRAKFAASAILSHSSKPLYLVVAVGLLFLLGAAALAIQTLVGFFRGSSVSGFTTVILLILITGSLVMLALGVIGAYIARIFDEVKRRPRYLVAARAESKKE
ncbi:MAG: glycosyltransferase family 2 protein [Oscillospiraceae bacterium]|nr:glycosyltransferase family 2 protein [Oscillospiraceae bacterium]